MGRKLLIGLVVVVSAICVLTSCSKKSRNAEDIISYLKNLQSYSCNVKIQIKNDKQKINYTGRQFYSNDYGDRFELGKDRVIIYKKNRMYVKDLNNGSSYETDENFDGLFKLCFIDEYVHLIYTNEKVENSFKKIYNEEYQIISMDIPGNNKNICKAQLYVNSSSASPKYLIIYDSDNKKRVKVEYDNFKQNVKLKDNLFDISTAEK